MTQAIYTIGKAPTVFYQTEDQEKAFQIWDHYRKTGITGMRVRVYYWPNGFECDEKGRYDLTGGRKVPAGPDGYPVIPYDKADIPPPRFVTTKTGTGMDDRADVDPLDPRNLARLFDLIVERLEEHATLETDLDESQERETNLRQQLADMTTRANDLAARVEALEGGQAFQGLQDYAAGQAQTASALAKKLGDKQAEVGEMRVQVADLARRLMALENGTRQASLPLLGG